MQKAQEAHRTEQMLLNGFLNNIPISVEQLDITNCPLDNWTSHLCKIMPIVTEIVLFSFELLQ